MTPPGGFLSDKALLARHGLPASRFAEVAGTRLHVVDEGQGPAVLLLHGSYASLRQWDAFAAVLAPHLRVVRFDWPAFGLSAPMADADYSAPRKVALIDALADALGLDRFVLVATSSAGVPGALYAAERGERLAGLILNNVAVGPVVHDPAAYPADLLDAIAADAAHPGWHSDAFWRALLTMHYADSSRLDEGTVARWTELNNRRIRPALAPDPAAAEAEFARTPGDLPGIAVPTLLLWSDRDLETTLEREGQAALALLGSADKALVVVPDCGHMMPDERGALGAQLALPFLRRVAGG